MRMLGGNAPVSRCCKAGCGEAATMVTVESLPEPLCPRHFEHLEETRGADAERLRAAAVTIEQWRAGCPPTPHGPHVGCESLYSLATFRCPFCGIEHSAAGSHHCQRVIPGMDALVSPWMGSLDREAFMVSVPRQRG